MTREFSTEDLETLKIIAFYLPQFHPFKENNEWWGPGFTEWTKVAPALPLFRGHYQPHIPADLGFYDLRLPETMYHQVRFAKQYGIYGFCYHYYWFSGRRIMNRPIDQMLADPKVDMPFCLCWANQEWNRRWLGRENEILLEQKYLPDDDVDFIESVMPFFLDDRYIKIAGEPLLVIYMPELFPDIQRSISVWREACRKHGFDDLYVISALTNGETEYGKYGMRGGVEFPPHGARAVAMPEAERPDSKLSFHDHFRGWVVDYKDVADDYLTKSYAEPNIFKAVYPSWDNTARMRSKSLITLNAVPENYEYWLKQAAETTLRAHAPDRRLLFVNAWNEWGEGCHLEPDRKFGHGFLQATLDVKTGASRAAGIALSGLPPGPEFLRRRAPFRKPRGRNGMKFGKGKIRRELARLAKQVRGLFFG